MAANLGDFISNIFSSQETDEDNSETTIYQDISNTYNLFIAAENEAKYDHNLQNGIFYFLTELSLKLENENDDYTKEYNNNIIVKLFHIIIIEVFIKKIFLETIYNLIILKVYIYISFILTFIFKIFIPYFFTYPLYNRITSNI
jgi:hypothetical protein